MSIETDATRKNLPGCFHVLCPIATKAAPSLATCVESHRNGEGHHGKVFPARAPETTREGACAPQKSLMIGAKAALSGDRRCNWGAPALGWLRDSFFAIPRRC